MAEKTITISKAQLNKIINEKVEKAIKERKQENFNIDDIKPGITVKYIVPGELHKTAIGKIIGLDSTKTEDFAIIKVNGKERYIPYSHIGSIIKEQSINESIDEKMKKTAAADYKKLEKILKDLTNLAVNAATYSPAMHAKLVDVLSQLADHTRYLGVDSEAIPLTDDLLGKIKTVEKITEAFKKKQKKQLNERVDKNIKNYIENTLSYIGDFPAEKVGADLAVTLLDTINNINFSTDDHKIEFFKGMVDKLQDLNKRFTK